MKSWRIEPARKALRGAVRVPGDKSIGHRALLLGALANGASTVRGLSHGADNAATRRAFEQLGVRYEPLDEGALRIHGVGLDGLRAPAGAIDCGNSGTTMRLLAGVLVAQHFESVLAGDPSLSRRPMARVTRPLRARGGRIDGEIEPRRNDETPPLAIRALPKSGLLNELEWRPEVASAQVKSSILLSGLFAAGPTLVQEEVVTRDHTERMLQAMGVPVQSMGPAVFLDPDAWGRELAPIDLTVPGDPSSAAFLVVAAHVVPGSRLVVKHVGLNPTRTGAYDVLRDMGGGVVVQPHGDQAGEPVGDLHVGAYEPAELRQPARVGGELAVRSIDEAPALVAAAAACNTTGVSEFRDLRELRVKESDRIEALASMLRAFGRDVEVLPDGLRVPGGGPIRGGAEVDSHGDHRIAMSAAILALRAEGPTLVRDTACVDTSFPEFVGVLRKLGATLEVIEDDRPSTSGVG